MKIVPVNLKEANASVSEYHRHHKAVTGCKFCIGLQDDNGELCGAAICGRPVSRFLDTGLTLEITRLCTVGDKNACSMLYGACVRAAKAMGYHRVITYTLESEDGASLKASNFEFDGIAGGVSGRESENEITAYRRKEKRDGSTFWKMRKRQTRGK